MPKIVSRQATDANHIQTLQQALTNFSLGAVTTDASGVLKVGDDLDTLVTQTVSVMAGLVQTIEHAAVDISIARAEATSYSLRVDELESVVENLLSDVSYDDALDHAAADLMDCFTARSTSNYNADGRLVFNERDTFSKEDIKPMLREAIVRWIELKLQQ